MSGRGAKPSSKRRDSLVSVPLVFKRVWSIRVWVNFLPGHLHFMGFHVELLTPPAGHFEHIQRTVHRLAIR